LGNLLNRSISMLKRYRGGVVPKRSDELAPEIAGYVGEVRQALQRSELQSALESIWKIVNRANKYVEEKQPFKLAKEDPRLDEVLYNLTECCRVIAVCLWPFIPQTSEKIFAQLAIKDAPNRLSEAQWGGLLKG